jgi:hypothetical protein
MPPFNVLVSDVPDTQLGSLLSRLQADGLSAQVVSTDGTPAPPASPRPSAAGAGDLPSEWRLVRELDGQSYAWPKDREEYERFRVYAADVPEGTVHIAIGEAGRAEVWGRDRKYLITFLTSGSPTVPLVEFLAVDDHADTGDMLAIIRGSDGGKKMYGPGDHLPDVYREHFTTAVFNERIVYPRAFSKYAVIAHEDDTTTMLNHALVQARRRGDV